MAIAQTSRREFLTAAAAALSAGALPPARAQTTAAPAVPASARAAAAAVEASRDAILRISREVWLNAELPFKEVKSSAIHVRELEAAGFRVATGTSGVPTAFVAEWSQGTGGPKIGFLPEYDALPGLGNAAEPRETPGPNGVEVGHGCGHNMIGAGCTGGAIALKRMMQADGTPGTIRVLGCAAEEGGAVKVYMVRDGLLSDLDAALAWHPAPFAGVGEISTAATDSHEIRFRGRSAHAGNEPWAGRSALKAAELFAHGLNLMREHLPPTARLHYVYANAGEVANVVPAFARVLLQVRDKDRAGVRSMSEWAKQVAQGAALATQTRAEFDPQIGYHHLLPNKPLIDALYGHILAGPPVWTDAEQEFARTIQREMGVEARGMSVRPLPVLGPMSVGAGSDLGDVSFMTPTGVFAWPTLPVGVSLHTWGVTACAGMSIGDKSSLATARILAGVGRDLMTDARLREAARADLRRRVGDYVYVSPIPEGRRVPAGVPDAFRQTGEDEITSGLRNAPPL